MSLEADLAPIHAKLQTAVELELTTIPPYLVAFYSIKPGTNIAAANLIRSVFMEEMLHMILAANVLASIGGRLSMTETQAPVYPCQLTFKGKAFRDREFDVHLEPLSQESLATFMKIELPQFPTHKLLVANLVIDGFTVGEFYQGIIQDLTIVCNTHGESQVFSDKIPQVSEQYFWGGGGKPVIVKSLATAKEAINLIVEQGEGAHVAGGTVDLAAGPLPHYHRFREIHDGRHYRTGDPLNGPPTGDVLPVDYANVQPIKIDCKDADFTEQPDLLHLNRLFNSNYSQMLRQIAEGFNGNPQAFYTAILNGMHNLTPLARQMMEIPIQGDAQRRHGAPSFEWIAE